MQGDNSSPQRAGLIRHPELGSQKTTESALLLVLLSLYWSGIIWTSFYHSWIHIYQWCAMTNLALTTSLLNLRWLHYCSISSRLDKGSWYDLFLWLCYLHTVPILSDTSLYGLHLLFSIYSFFLCFPRSQTFSTTVLIVLHNYVMFVYSFTAQLLVLSLNSIRTETMLFPSLSGEQAMCEKKSGKNKDQESKSKE